MCKNELSPYIPVHQTVRQSSPSSSKSILSRRKCWDAASTGLNIQISISCFKSIIYKIFLLFSILSLTYSFLPSHSDSQRLYKWYSHLQKNLCIKEILPSNSWIAFSLLNSPLFKDSTPFFKSSHIFSKWNQHVYLNITWESPKNTSCF